MQYSRLKIAVGDRPTIKGDDVIYFDARDCGVTPFVQGDMTEPLPFEDYQFSLIQACHCLEHVSHLDVDRVLAQWVVKLAHEGVLHVEVPNLTYQAIRILMNPQDEEAIQMMFGQQNLMESSLNQHRCAFTAPLLSEKLKKAGLSDGKINITGATLVAEGSRLLIPR